MVLFDSKYYKPIPELTDIVNWEKVYIQENSEPLIDIETIKHKRIIFSKHYHKQGLSGAIDKCYLRERIMRKINNIANRLPPNYSLLIYDGWRPFRLQKELYDQFKHKIRFENKFENENELEKYINQFVSPGSQNPTSPSPHFTGGAIDLTICENGKQVDMGTGFDDLTEKAYTEYYENKKGEDLNKKDEEVLKNRRLLFNIMTEEDFTSYKYEWWHFDFGNQVWGNTKNRTADYGGIFHL